MVVYANKAIILTRKTFNLSQQSGSVLTDNGTDNLTELPNGLNRASVNCSNGYPLNIPVVGTLLFHSLRVHAYSAL